MLILPEQVLERNKMNNENISSIFKPDETDAVRFEKFYYDMLKTYAFSDDDYRAFRSQDWRRRAKVRGTITNALIKYAKPKIEYFNGSGRKVVMLIDPIRLIHDMLVSESRPNQKFTIWLSEWKKIENGNYDFTVERKVEKSKGKNENSLYAQMISRVNNGK